MLHNCVSTTAADRRHRRAGAAVGRLARSKRGPLAMGLSAKYTSSRRVSLTADWYADAYVNFSGEAVSDRLRSTEFSIVANNLLDQAYLSAITEPRFQ